MARFFWLKQRGRVFYARLRRDGVFLPWKSTGKTTRSDAELIAMQWVVQGVPNGPTPDHRSFNESISFERSFEILKSLELTPTDAKRLVRLLESRNLLKGATVPEDGPDFIPWLLWLWDFEESPRVREILAHGGKIGLRHCKEARDHINRHWAPYFKDKKLAEVIRSDLNDFGLFLAEGNRQPNTINNILRPGTVALRWAAKNGTIQTDPTAGLRTFTGKSKKRGILSDDEINRLFSQGDWLGNDSARLGNLLACATGMRSGEVVALRVQDIGPDRIHIRHSWSQIEGLKDTKTGEARDVPILPSLRQQLLDHVDSNPVMPSPASPDQFVFWSSYDFEKPTRQTAMNHRLIGALHSIGITEEQRKTRNITFHGWRHRFATVMARELDQRTMKLTGHATASVFEAYAAHGDESDFTKAAKAIDRAFGSIVAFPGGKEVTG